MPSVLGSIAGGTEVTIDGDGFISGRTRLIIGDLDYTNLTMITYGKITFRTGSPPASYLDAHIPIFVVVAGASARCLPMTCGFRWMNNLTAYLDQVDATQITGPAMLNFTGRNLNARNNTTEQQIHLQVGDTVCNVTAASNQSVSCHVGSLGAGDHMVRASIDGKTKQIVAVV
jgi:hypothetical protein